MSYSYEELRAVAFYILSGRESGSYESNQYEHFKIAIAEVLTTRASGQRTVNAHLPSAESELFLELFWELFRQGIITIGLNDSNREFPFFRVSSFGKKILEGSDPYFFHDVTTYESLVKARVPNIDPITLIYLKEAVQAFKTGCVLSLTVMIGVATEHSFLLLMDVIQNHPEHSNTFQKVLPNRGSLQSVSDQLRKLHSDSNPSILFNSPWRQNDSRFWFGDRT